MNIEKGAGQPESASTASFADGITDEPRWWKASFQMQWNKETSPKWYYGPLIAEQVILPVLEVYGGTIQLWRFHRRAGLDTTGHRFSFFYYTDKNNAENIAVLIRKNNTIAELSAEGAISSVDIEPYGAEEGIKISATSDANWTPIMKETWPYFLMGVSRMWLEQVIHFSEKVRLETTLDNGEDGWVENHASSAHYIKVQSELSHLWQQEGLHAYFHHLNAAYAYQPLLQRY
ncbi:MAG: hypothetical protein JKY01_09810 [Pseudomonadales bacterium]|nr:hypothetical protein [Pseudomonadales bacterium]